MDPSLTSKHKEDTERLTYYPKLCSVHIHTRKKIKTYSQGKAGYYKSTYAKQMFSPNKAVKLINRGKGKKRS